MNRILKTSLLFASLSFLSYCKDTKTGNPSDRVGTVELIVQGTKPNELNPTSFFPSSTQIDVNDTEGNVVGQLTLNDARIGLSEIELNFSNSESSEDEVDFEGPFLVDLLTNTATPSLSSIQLPSGIYREIQLKLEKLDDSYDDDHGDPLVDPEDPLYDNSIYLEGTYTGETASGSVSNIPFTLSFDLSEEFELTPKDMSSLGIAIESGVDQTIIIAFRLAQWFLFDNTETNNHSVSFDEVVLSSGEIILNKDSSGTNDDIRDVIEKNIKNSADYGEDKDDDGKLGSDEDEDDDDEIDD